MDSLTGELGAWSPLELAVVLLALVYLILAARQSIWCWPAAFVSTAIYFGLFLNRQLYQQSLLQVFYLGMAIYGFLKWRGRSALGTELPVSTWSARRHAFAITAVLILAAITGWLEARYTSAPLPYLDAFTSWGSVVTTWMVTQKVLENWLYWLVVDALLVYVSYASNLPATALLFVVYLGIVVAGYFSWRRTLPERSTAAVA